jgi:hypothetical protein
MPLQATSGAASYDAFGGGVPVVPQYIEEVFQTWLYTGNGSTQTITNGVDLAGKGGLVWGKSRSVSADNVLVDSTRGIANTLVSNSTGAQNAIATAAIGSFNSNGFSFSGNSDINASPNTYCSWTFRKQPKFFDVVTYTGNGTAGRTVSHNLGSVPGCIIVKRTSGTGDWAIYHRSLGNTKYLQFSTLAAGTNSTYWNNTSPTSTNFTLGTIADVNANGSTYVAYLFAHDAGGFGLTGTDNVISCGSYSGSGAAGNAQNLGYEPQWVLIKRTDSADDWHLFDNMRGIATGGNDAILYPNLSNAEFTTGNRIALTATGFTFEGSNLNASGGTYIYIAIRRGPMKVPTSGTSVYNAISRTGTGATANVTGVGFPPDMLLDTMRSTNWTRSMWDRLRGPNLRIATNQTSAENSYTDAVMAYGQDGVTLGADGNVDVNGSGYTYINWFFRRAPSFMDVVCWKSDGTGNPVNHNLTVKPTLLIAKSRSNADNWDVAFFDTNTSTYRIGDSGAPFIVNNTTGWGTTTAPSGYVGASDFTPSVFWDKNVSGRTYVAYLFATCAGVSKVGSYTGTATTKQIDCGFTGGARFVLIKRTDSTGDWYVWDTARGIVSGNDSYLLLNSTAAEVTNTDYIDTYSAGFEISSTAPAAINASGGSFIFFAVA